MNKLYSLLIAAAICSATHVAGASERSENVFFDEPTKEVLTETALAYGLGSYFLHGMATVGGLVVGVENTYDERSWEKKYGRNFSVIKSLRKEIPEMVFSMNKDCVRVHKVAAPLAIAYVAYNTAYNKYEQYKPYK